MGHSVGPGGSEITIDGKCPPFTSVQIKGLLQTEIGTYDHKCRIPFVLAHVDYPLPFRAPISGHAQIAWYYVSAGAHLSRTTKPLLVAHGQRTFSAAARAKITLKLTAKGIKLLRNAKRIHLTAKGRFTPKGQAAVSATKGFALTS